MNISNVESTQNQQIDLIAILQLSIINRKESEEWRAQRTHTHTKKKTNPIKRFHFQWQRTFEYLALESAWEAFAFSFLIRTVSLVLLCQKPIGWNETNPLNH